MDIERVGYSEVIRSKQKLTESSQLLSNVRIGDVLKGALNKLPTGQVVLVSEGMEPFPVQLSGTLILNETVTLKVIDKQDKQVILQLLQEDIGEVAHSLQNKILQEFNLPPSPLMHKLIDSFLAKQLPMQREALLRAYHMAEHFDIPAETLTNLTEQNSGLTLKEAKQMYEVKQTHLNNVLGETTKFMAQTQSIDLTKNIYDVLDQFLKQDTLEDVLKKVFPKQVKAVQVEDLEVQDILVKKNTIENILVGSNRPFQLFEKEEVMKAGQNEVSIARPMTPHESVEFDITQVLMRFTEKDWTKLSKITQRLLKKALAVNVNDTEAIVHKEQLDKQQKVLDALTKALENASSNERGMQLIKYLEDTTQVVQKFNMQGEYYFFPLQLPKGEGQGELYFFKPKKKKEAEKNYLYMVLALDLPTLNKLEVHMRKEEQKVLLHFKLKEKQMIHLFENHVRLLKKHLEGSTLNIDEIVFSLMEEKAMTPLATQNINQMSRMDFRI